MQDKDFDIIIDKYLKDELSIEEKDHVEQWLQHITDHKAADLLTIFEREESRTYIYKELHRRITSEKAADKKSSLILHIRPVFKIAASLFLCCCLLFLFRSRLEEVFNIRQYASTINQGKGITKTILSDGSIVWLKGKSRLTYPVKFKGNLRSVDLEGEALFEVAKDHAHPFVIHCAGLKTRVLGTSFNIKQSGRKIEVNVLTGRVLLSSAHAAAITLHPYQKAVYSALKKTIIKEKDPVLEIVSLTKWTEYNMLFNDAGVGEVLQRIEKKFEVHITLRNQKITNNRITADFTDQSLLNTISMMSEAFNLDFRIEGNDVTLADKHNINNQTLN